MNKKASQLIKSLLFNLNIKHKETAIIISLIKTQFYGRVLPAESNLTIGRTKIPKKAMPAIEKKATPPKFSYSQPEPSIANAMVLPTAKLEYRL